MDSVVVLTGATAHGQGDGGLRYVQSVRYAFCWWAVSQASLQALEQRLLVSR